MNKSDSACGSANLQPQLHPQPSALSSELLFADFWDKGHLLGRIQKIGEQATRGETQAGRVQRWDTVYLNWEIYK